MKKILIPVLSIMGFAPMIALATDTTAGDIMFTIGNLLGYVTPVLVTIAVIYFIYTVIVYTMSGDDKKKADAKKNIIPALIGLFLIVAFWGILSVVSNTFNVGPEPLREEQIPCVPNRAMGITCQSCLVIMIFQFLTIPIAEASVASVIGSINRILINPLIILLFALATFYFLYGLVQYFIQTDNKNIREETNKKITYGLIGMFIMIAVYGILNTYLNTINEKRINIDRNTGIKTIVN